MSGDGNGATIRPFRALHYDPRRVRFADVVSPPFDVITAEQRAALAVRSEHNVVHLILPGPGAEADAHALLCAWRADGIIVQDTEPCIYVVEQDYAAPDGTRLQRDGFIALVRIEPYERGVVLPHEGTRPGPIDDRLALLRATRAQLSPIFGIYHDAGGVVQRSLVAGRDASAEIDVTDDDGTRHRLWRVPGESPTAVAALARSTILIADGHHRYATALRYREECDDDAAGWALFYLVSAAGGATIFPTHRVIDDVDAETAATLPAALAARGLAVAEVDDADGALRAVREGAAFAVLRPGASALLVRSDEQVLDTELVQDALLGPLLQLDAAAVATTDRIAYLHRADEAAAALAPGRIALLVRAPTIGQVEDAARAGRTMPPKTTYFFPKTVDGFVFYGLDDC